MGTPWSTWRGNARASSASCCSASSSFPSELPPPEPTELLDLPVRPLGRKHHVYLRRFAMTVGDALAWYTECRAGIVALPEPGWVAGQPPNKRLATAAFAPEPPWPHLIATNTLPCLRPIPGTTLARLPDRRAESMGITGRPLVTLLGEHPGPGRCLGKGWGHPAGCDGHLRGFVGHPTGSCCHAPPWHRRASAWPRQHYRDGRLPGLRPDNRGSRRRPRRNGRIAVGTLSFAVDPP